LSPFTLKNDFKACDSELAKRTIARKVLNPPFKTAGPMFLNAWVALLFLEPVAVKNARPLRHQNYGLNKLNEEFKIEGISQPIWAA